MSNTFHLIVDRDMDTRDLVCKPTQPNRILDAIVEQGYIATWDILTPASRIVVYYALSGIVPESEQLEKINDLAQRYAADSTPQ